MSKNILISQRNQSVELCKLIASFFVVCIHCDFPGRVFILLNTLARFAVPFFFAVSGYYSYQIRDVQIKKRMAGILKLILLSTLLYILYDCFCCIKIYGTGIPAHFLEKAPPRKLFSMLLLHANPVSGHLWYLNAILFCYLSFYLYTKWTESQVSYRPLYYISAFLLVLFLLMDSFCPAFTDRLDTRIYRNGLFFGLPMFTLGLFLREYGDKIRRVFPASNAKLCLIILAGCLLAMLQRYGTDNLELPIGMLLALPAILLLCIRTPQLTRRPVLCFLISKFGTLSTTVYITHLIWLNLYLFYAQPVLVPHIGQTSAELFAPLAAFICSLCTGILWEVLRTIRSRLFP